MKKVQNPFSEYYVVIRGDLYIFHKIGELYLGQNNQFYEDNGKDIIYEDRMDAMYEKLILALSSGTPLENYKGSKYYLQYIERLKIKNPEYLI